MYRPLAPKCRLAGHGNSEEGGGGRRAEGVEARSLMSVAERVAGEGGQLLAPLLSINVNPTGFGAQPVSPQSGGLPGLATLRLQTITHTADNHLSRPFALIASVLFAPTQTRLCNGDGFEL